MIPSTYLEKNYKRIIEGTRPLSDKFFFLLKITYDKKNNETYFFEYVHKEIESSIVVKQHFQITIDINDNLKGIKT